MRVRLFCVVAALTATATLGFAQAPSFSARSHLVSLAVLVTDSSGEPVTSLRPEAFSIFEDGKARPVAAFARERVPVSLAVALDASLSMSGERFRLAGEAVRALAGESRPGDQLAVAAFNETPFLVSPWTSNVAAAVAALVSVTPKGRTALYDGVEMGLDLVGNATNPSGALVVISDGNDVHRADMRPMREAQTIDRIRRSDVTVFAIGLNAPPEHAGDPAAEFDAISLARLSEPSGGFAHVVTTASALPRAARTIRAQLDRRYLVGFVPEQEGDGRFHRVRVEVSGCRCKVRTRAGFVAARP